jgi:diadenosine tetraphosphatase ApaH/serine/threonine PP2A family protein phosphatase
VTLGLVYDVHGNLRASYAVLHPDGRVEHRRVAYDHEAAAAASRERHPGFGETIARRIERASFVL